MNSQILQVYRIIKRFATSDHEVSDGETVPQIKRDKILLELVREIIGWKEKISKMPYRWWFKSQVEILPLWKWCSDVSATRHNFFFNLYWVVLSCDLIVWTFLGPPLTLCGAWLKAVGCFCTWMEPVVEHTFYKQSVSLGKDISVYRWMTFWAWVRNTCEPWKSVMNNYVGFGFPIP